MIIFKPTELQGIFFGIRPIFYPLISDPGGVTAQFCVTLPPLGGFEGLEIPENTSISGDSDMSEGAMDGPEMGPRHPWATQGGACGTFWPEI